jgi:ribosomal protein S18 acetylase RimI-like enzyme
VFGFPPEAGRAVYEWELAVSMGPGSACYVATQDGVPVGTSQVLYAAGVPGIYNVGVQEECRGRGLGAALTLRPLLEARAPGYRAGVLQSSESGLPVYRRLGFEQLCRLDFYALELGRSDAQ